MRLESGADVKIGWCEWMELLVLVEPVEESLWWDWDSALLMLERVHCSLQVTKAQQLQANWTEIGRQECRLSLVWATKESITSN